MSTSAPDTEIAIHRAGAQRMGFFTDTSVCIGCKACEVACKQWNDLPADGSQSGKGGSYDHTGDLSASSWRHVRFVELLEPSPQLQEEAQRALDAGAGGKLPAIPAAGAIDLVDAAQPAPDVVDVAEAVRKMGDWVFMSDVCKHCTNAGCLDACPTGALIRTEHQTVVLQPDVCNGCGYCVPACPFGVVDRDPTTAAPANARSVTTASRTDSSRRARSRARPTRSSSDPTRSWWRSPLAGSPSCTSAASRAPTYTAPATNPASSSPAVSARSSC